MTLNLLMIQEVIFFGDYLIKKIADRLSVLENENIFVSRFQGDEFIIACNFYEKFYLDEFIERIQLLFKRKNISGR